MLTFIEYQAILPTPFATLGLKLKNDSVEKLDFIFEDVSTPVFRNALAEKIAEQINSYLSDATYQFTLPISPRGTTFQRSVWSQLQMIPQGSCRSYGEVAKDLQSGPRAVGNACRKNPIPLIVPCHRIVAKNSLGGFAGSITGQLVDVKRWLLHHESCRFV